MTRTDELRAARAALANPDVDPREPRVLDRMIDEAESRTLHPERRAARRVTRQRRRTERGENTHDGRDW